MSKIWNVPNSLSMIRLLLIIPMGVALWHQENMIAVLIGLLSSITDNLDGYFARRLNQITEFGKAIDPLSDKLFVGVIVIILLIQGRMPLWFGLLIMGRDLLLMFGGIWASKRIGWILPSNIVGKITVSILGLTLIIMVLNIHSVAYYGLWASTIMLITSFGIYLARMFITINRSKKKTVKSDADN